MILAPGPGFPATTIALMKPAAQRRDALKGVWQEARTCVRCPLSESRTTVVFGAGDADADLMFIGEAPGKSEDEQGVPFVGAAGKLLDKLLAEIGMERSDVFIANVLKCRPPDNRDPRPAEIEACSGYLRSQIALIAPRVVCTLGNFSTKLLREDQTGITRLHGRPEVRSLGGRTVRLYPVFHPAAALYNPSSVEDLRADFARLPELLALPVPEQVAGPEGAATVVATAVGGDAAVVDEAAVVEEVPVGGEAAVVDEAAGAVAPVAVNTASPVAPDAATDDEGQLGLF